MVRVGRPSRLALLVPAILFLAAFLLVPALIFLQYSFWRSSQYSMTPDITLANYIRVLTQDSYRILLLRSLVTAAAAAALTIVVAFPLAYVMAFRARRYRDLLLFLVLVTLFTSYLVRIYAWRSVLSSNGVVDSILFGLGVTTEHQSYLLFSPFGTLLVLINVYVPFAVLPMFAALLNVPKIVLEASRDLGASQLTTFRRVMLPMITPGIVASFTFVFLLAAGDYVTPALVGGTDGSMIAGAIQQQFGGNFNWPVGSALSFTLTLVLALVLVVALWVLRRSGILRSIR